MASKADNPDATLDDVSLFLILKSCGIECTVLLLLVGPGVNVIKLLM